MTERVTFEVYNGSGYANRRFEEFASRAVRQRKNWLEVRYQGERYALNGGIRCPYWIDVTRPIIIWGA